MVDMTAEIRQQYAEMARWLGTPGPSHVLDSLYAALHPDFVLIDAIGRRRTRDQLREAMVDAAHSRPNLTMEVTAPERIADADGLLVGRFHAHRCVEGFGSERVVTAVFVKDHRARHGLRWLTAHATTVAGDAPRPPEL